MNTFAEIRTYNTIQKFNTRKAHNLRKTNLNDQDDKFLNLVQIFDKKIVLNKDEIIENNTSETRQDINKNISKYSSLLNKNKLELIDLLGQLDSFILSEKDSSSKEFQKINNKYNRKNETIKTNTLKIDEMIVKRDSIAKNYTKSNKNKRRKDFVEFVFSVTDMPKEFKKDLSYRDDLSEIVLEYIQKKGFKCHLDSLSIHLDQSNPHAHLLAQYDEDNSINKDLVEIFGKGQKQYYEFNKDFNKFVRNHPLIKKRKFEISEIVKGGNKEYVSLPFYKELEKNATKTFEEIIENMEKSPEYEIRALGLKGGVDYKKLYTDLKNGDLKELFIDNMIRKTIPSKSEIEYKKIFDENKKLTQTIDKMYSSIKYYEKLEEHLKNKDSSIEYYKKNEQKHLSTIEAKNNEIHELKAKYEHGNDINRSNKHR